MAAVAVTKEDAAKEIKIADLSEENYREQLKGLRKTDPEKARRFQRIWKKHQTKGNKKISKATKQIKERRPYVKPLPETKGNETIEIEYLMPEVDDVVEALEESVINKAIESGAEKDEEVAAAAARLLESYREVFTRFDEMATAHAAPQEDFEDRATTGAAETDDKAALRARLLQTQGETDDKKDDGLTRKQRKEQMRPSVATLKASALRPEVVEMWDTTSFEPFLLVSLKSCRNSVSVPSHWSSKRRYLSTKKGLDKTEFKLPEHIEATKIGEIRAALLEKEKLKTLKQKMRERARPKRHKMDIDYQVLHDAFFKYAKKPRMTTFGDLYYENKELEIKMRIFKPGQLSQRLKEALGMHSHLSPPPWLYNMQRYGPPKAYPNLKIPGVNSPLPVGAEFGFGIGGWGQPPVGPNGTPLWGDLSTQTDQEEADQGEWTKYYWGEMEDVDESEEEMEDLAEEGVEAALPVEEDDDAMTTGMLSTGGVRSVSLASTRGLDTPQSLDLRTKVSGYDSSSTVGAQKQAYTILREKEVTAAGGQPGQLFGTTKVYDLGYDKPDQKQS